MDFSLDTRIPMSYNYGPSPTEQLSQIMTLADAMDKRKMNQLTLQQTKKKITDQEALENFLTGQQQKQTYLANAPKPGDPNFVGPLSQAQTPVAPQAPVVPAPDMQAPTIAPDLQYPDTANAVQQPSVQPATPAVAPAPGEASQKAATGAIPPAKSTGTQPTGFNHYDFSAALTKVNDTYEKMLQDRSLAGIADSWKTQQIDQLDKASQVLERYNRGMYYYNRGTPGDNLLSKEKKYDIGIGQAGAAFNSILSSRDPDEQKYAYAAGYQRLMDVGYDVGTMPKPEEFDPLNPDHLAQAKAIVSLSTSIKDQNKNKAQVPNALGDMPLQDKQQTAFRNDFMKLDALTASGRSALGLTGRYQTNLDRALDIIKDPTHVVTQQDLAGIIGDQAQILTGKGATEEDMRSLNYTSLIGEIAKIIQPWIGHPMEAIPDEIKEHITHRLEQMQDVNRKITNKGFGTFKALHGEDMPSQLNAFLGGVAQAGIASPAQLFNENEWSNISKAREKMGLHTIGYRDPINNMYLTQGQMEQPGIVQPDMTQPVIAPKGQPGMTTKKAPAKDKYPIGQHIWDAKGNEAIYLGNGKFREIKGK